VRREQPADVDRCRAVDRPDDPDRSGLGAGEPEQERQQQDAEDPELPGRTEQIIRGS
jgi:hypothetical protein